MLEELIWVFGVLVWSNLPWVALVWSGRKHPAVMSVVAPESGADAPGWLPLLLVALYVGELLLLWLTLADGDVGLLDRAIVVVLIALLTFGKRALALIPVAVSIRAAIALLDGVPQPFSGDLFQQPWRLLDPRLYWDQAWLWHDPGVVGIAVAGIVGLTMHRLVVGREFLPLWAIFASALLVEGSYLLSVWFDWSGPDAQMYATRESWANLLGLFLSLLLWRLLWRGIRADWQQTRLQDLALSQARLRLNLLQQRIKPHFLFNALNCIHALIRRDPEKARRRLVDLADLMRALLKEDDEQVPLGSELRLLRAYLDIEQARYGERLRTHVDVPRTLEGEMIPGLILQPLVENAVRHGIASRPQGGEVWIRATTSADRLILEVEDDGTGLAMGDDEYTGNGMALGNSQERLRLLYGASASLTLEPRAQGGTRARLTLPRRKPVTERV